MSSPGNKGNGGVEFAEPPSTQAGFFGNSSEGLMY